MKKAILTCSLILAVLGGKAQVYTPKESALNAAQSAPQPFLFSVNTLTGSNPFWNVHYSGSYAELTTGPFGYNGLDQQLGVKGYLGNRFTLYASAAIGIGNSGGISSAQQAEVIRDFIGGKELHGFRLGAGLGLGRDWSNVASASSRITASLEQNNWRLLGNMRFEKAFDSSRDKLDFISSLGFQHRITAQWYLGFEAVAQDIEGFWEKDEAEGGAKMMLGPSLNLTPNRSQLSFSLSGGPVFYATKSQVIPSEAIRDIGPLASGNGYILRALVNFNLRK